MSLESIEQEKEEGEVEYRDGIRYIYSSPYGFDDADEFYIYTSSAPISELPEDFLSWVYGSQNMTTLPCYGIYNAGGKLGFVSGY